MLDDNDILSRYPWLAWLASKIERIGVRWKWIGRGLMFGATLYSAAIIFYGWQQIKESAWRPFLPAAIVSIVLYLVSLLLQMFVWMRMLSFHHPIGWRDIEIYMRTILLRRLPGGVWHWAGRVTLYKAATSTSVKVIMLANLLEWCMLIIAACGIIGLFMTTLLSGIRIALVTVSLGVNLALCLAWQPKSRALLDRLVESLVWIIAYGICWVLGGIILYLMTAAVAHTHATVFDITSIWSIAGGVSSLVVFAPAGLGVRELTLAFLLKGYVTFPIAALIAIMNRVIFIISDMLWGGIGSLASHYVVNKTV